MSTVPTGGRSGSNPRQSDFLSQFQSTAEQLALGQLGPSYLGGAPQTHRIRIPAIKSAFKGGPAGIGHAGSVGPRYSQGEQYSQFVGRDPAYISRIQSQLITAGILDPKHGKPGRWTPQTAAAMEAVMGHANWSGTSWHGALGDLVEAGEVAGYGVEDDPEFVPTPFLARTRIDPDPKVARQKVKDLVAQIVGREYATPEIIDKYTASLISDYHRQFNQEERLRREEHEATQTIERSQFNASVGEGEVVDESDLQLTGHVKGIDPESNLRAELEKRFKPTIEGIQQHDLAQDRPTSFFQSLNSLINMGTTGEQAPEL